MHAHVRATNLLFVVTDPSVPWCGEFGVETEKLFGGGWRCGPRADATVVLVAVVAVAATLVAALLPVAGPGPPAVRPSSVAHGDLPRRARLLLLLSACQAGEAGTGRRHLNRRGSVGREQVPAQSITP